MTGYLLLAIVGFSLAAFYVGRASGARFVAAHGGRIWAEPTRSGGTAFHFTIIDADSEEAKA